MALPARTPRPLVGAKDRTVGGSHMDSSSFMENPDITFIPGYSDKRRQIDYELGRGLEPSIALTHRYQWVRTGLVNGQSTRQKVIQFKGQRYERVTVGMLDGLGISMPVAAEQTPDGGIRLGDTELFYCSAEVAAENEAKQHRASSSNAEDSSASELHSAGREIDRSGNLTSSETKQRVEVTRT